MPGLAEANPLDTAHRRPHGAHAFKQRPSAVEDTEAPIIDALTRCGVPWRPSRRRWAPL